jgi:hypothetical protein
MAVNVERFKNDLDRLIREGVELENAMTYDVAKDEVLRLAREEFQNHETQVKDWVNSLPDFKKNYEKWYSESLAVLRQLLPDRVANFVGFYEKPKGRKEIAYGDYVIQDYLQGTIVTDYRIGGRDVTPSAALPQYKQQLAILQAAQVRFESSLFEIRQLVQADLFDSEIGAARELMKNKFFRAAGAIAGVVLEKHLYQVCTDHGIKVVKKNPGIGDLNELLKSSSVIDVPQWRHITLLGDLRNLCAHKKEKEPSAQQVNDLIDGTDKVLKTIA